MIERGETIRRGEFLTTEVRDTTRVTHPKTADIVHFGEEYIVVPVARMNGIVRRGTFGEAMEYIERYIGANE